MKRLFLMLALSATAAHAQEVQGVVQPFKSVLVSSPVQQEVIEKILFEEGDTVKEGQVLVQLRHAREELMVDQARKLVEQTEFVAKGLSSLANENMGSRDQALKAKTEHELAKIRLALDEENLKEKSVRSPLNGIVVKKYKETGESVDRAEKIVEIVDIDRLYAQFYTDPKFLQSLQVAQPINVRFPDLKEAAVTGKISFLDPRIDVTSGLFRVKVLIDNPGRKIKAGMRAMADFTKK